MTSSASTAESVLSALETQVSSSVKERLRRERIYSAADLAGLDKDDLKELGLSMLARSKVLRWAAEMKQNQAAPVTTPTPGEERDAGTPMRTSSADSMMLPAQFCDMEAIAEDGDGVVEVAASVQRLDDVESRADFWCRLITDAGTAVQFRYEVEQVSQQLRGADAAGMNLGHGDLRENILEKFFDLSPERIKEVYESIDMDSDGRILKDELREGLSRCELHGLETVLDRVLNAVGESSGSLQLVEFESVLTRLKLAQLLSVGKQDSPIRFDRLRIMDYNRAKVETRVGNMRDYFFGHRGSEYPMRWVHLREFDLTLLLALTVKYQLHPLSVEDVIGQAPTKLDRYEGHYFGVIEQLSVVGAKHGREPVYVTGRHVSVFCAGPPFLDTVITVAQADRSFAQDWPGEVTPAGPGTQDDAWVVNLQKRLRAVRSRVRERRADFLMYEIIDLCADDLRVVTHVFTSRLNYLEDIQRKAEFNSDSSKMSWFNEVGLIKLQLAVVARRLRGLQRILRRLADDPDLSPHLNGYLQDVADHVIEAYDDAGHLGEKCTVMGTAYEHAEDKAQDKVHRQHLESQAVQDERMNKMLFILTVLTTVFTPLTFMAGVYGMNFQDMAGHPSIPELLWPEGYFYFWVITIVYLTASTCGGILLWRRVRRPRQRSDSRVREHSDYATLPAAPV